eukprot:2534604-Pleurochrysis_carterae.AAC.1
MEEQKWHKWSVGRCKLHVKAGAQLGYKFLMIQPPFKAWFRRAASGRTTLLIAFKLLVMHESGTLDLPPNCHYLKDEINRSKAIAVKTLKEMKFRGYPLSAGLLRLTGEPVSSFFVRKALELERREKARMRTQQGQPGSSKRKRAAGACEEDSEMEEAQED